MKQIEELKIDEYQNDGNFVLNECIDWFNKYLETYDSFREIQKNREDLQIITTIKEQTEQEKSKYLFSIDLMNITTGQPLLEGTKMSMDSKNEKAGKFLMTAITTSYLFLNQDLHLQSLEEDGVRLENKEANNSALNVFVAEEDTLWPAFLDIMGNMNNLEVLKQKLSVAHEEALQEQGKIDDEFCSSIDKNTRSSVLAVKRYFYLHKRK